MNSLFLCNITLFKSCVQLMVNKFGYKSVITTIIWLENRGYSYTTAYHCLSCVIWCRSGGGRGGRRRRRHDLICPKEVVCIHSIRFFGNRKSPQRKEIGFRRNHLRKRKVVMISRIKTFTQSQSIFFLYPFPSHIFFIKNNMEDNFISQSSGNGNIHT